MRVFRQLAESPGGGFAFGPPKSQAGQRTVVFPDLIVPDLAWHLARFTGTDDDSLLFTSPTGNPLRNSNFRRRVWLPALADAGLADLHFHDLRHAGNVLAAAAGANLRELMERMGHSTTRAAMVYLHSTDEWQRKVADALGDLARSGLQADKKRTTGRSASGAQGRKSYQMITTSNEDMQADLVIHRGAPSATRTRDLLLRRRFPNVA